ncbi:MAG TPA: tyrosine-type recombinase/integrase [Candidatus Kurthia intestinigallinarum]|nr:tyrosine-type recombinase/integrase [Candidatus Kurthia intestinigallinarum]
MRYVQPIRDMDQVQEFMEYFEATDKRDFIMFMLGINLGLRISDILQLKVKDVRENKKNGQIRIRNSIKIQEKKTGKFKQIVISYELKKALKEYTEEMNAQDYLIQSRKKTKTGARRPITREQAYKILKDAAEAIGYRGDIGTHTLRKTFAYHFYQQTQDVATLQIILNHHDQADTLRYIGIEEDKVNKVVNGLFKRRKEKAYE